ncbi:MAG: hypothetical protein KIT36_21520 [Alphaproteobacteria bacterium]|nr:hypothetical protein [Alphaproteobacteria bacterium]
MTLRYPAVAGLALSLLATPALAGPSMNTRWAVTSLPQAQCVEHARESLANAGFTNIKNSAQSAFGEHGQYSMVVRCLADKQLVFFVVAGPAAEECRRLTSAVADPF